MGSHYLRTDRQAIVESHWHGYGGMAGDVERPAQVADHDGFLVLVVSVRHGDYGGCDQGVDLVKEIGKNGGVVVPDLIGVDNRIAVDTPASVQEP